MYVRPVMVERGSFYGQTKQRKSRFGWDQWRGRRARRCWDDDWDN